MSTRIPIQFLGILTADMVRGRHTDGAARRVTKVEIMAEGAPPSGASLAFKLRVADVENSQSFTLAAGETYISTAVTGTGLAVAADAALDVICKTAANAQDVTVWLTIDTLSVTGSTEEDLGLGMLSTLKAQLLNPGIVGTTDYDAVISAIGKGVAVAFDRYCNRKLKRASGTTQDFDAPRDHLILERYPVESVASIALKTDETSGFVTQSGLPLTIAGSAGLVHLGFDLGGNGQIIRATFTGGYWYDDSTDQSGSLPSGATALPADITLAWFNQCRDTWQKIDRLGINLGAEGATKVRWSVSESQLTDGVKEMLNPYRRMALV